MWFGMLIPLVTQAAKVDQVNGTWALVERWDGELVDLQADCLGANLNEGQLLILSSTQLEACAPDPLVRDSPLLSQDGVFWQK